MEHLVPFTQPKEFLSRARSHFDAAMADGRTATCLLADIADLACFNHLHTHTAGGALLKAVWDVMRSAPPDVIVDRVGGDEFVALWLHRDVEDHIRDAKRLTQRLGGPYQFERVSVAAEVDWAVVSSSSGSLDELLERCEDKLYEAKQRRPRPSGLRRALNEAHETGGCPCEDNYGYD